MKPKPTINGQCARCYLGSVKVTRRPLLVVGCGPHRDQDMAFALKHAPGALVMAVNRGGHGLPVKPTYIATLHLAGKGEYMVTGKEEVHALATPRVKRWPGGSTRWDIKPMASSGLFGVIVGAALGYCPVVTVGIEMDKGWYGSAANRSIWKSVWAPVLRGRVFGLSGLPAELFGPPPSWW